MTMRIEKLIKIIERKKRIDPPRGEENCSSFRK